MEINYESAERLILAAVNEDRKLTEAESTELAVRFGWDHEYQEKQYRRLKRILNLQMIAGSPLDRELLRRLVEKLTATEPASKKTRLAAKRLAEVNEALTQLADAKLSPPHSGPEYNFSRQFARRLVKV